jgi:ATP-binding cassette subfamily G (WHITE) protein 2 (SNQ2)
VALLVGSVFYQQPTSASGAFTRGGVLFLGLLFNALTSFSELPGQMMVCSIPGGCNSAYVQGRPILYRQVGYRFYRPAAFALAAVIADIPYNATNIFAFTIILYFMAGLYTSAGAYFTFYLFVSALSTESNGILTSRSSRVSWSWLPSSEPWEWRPNHTMSRQG